MLLHHRSRVIQIAQFLRAAAPAQHRRRGGRLPRQQQPDGLRLEYFKRLRTLVVAPLVEAAHPAKVQILAALQLERAARPDRTDALFPKAHVKDIVDRAAHRATEAIRPRELHQVAEQFGRRTDAFQRAQLDRQVRQAIGVPLSAVEKPTVDRIPLFVSSNVELIKTVPDRYFDRMIRDVTDAYESGMRPETLAARLVDLDDMAESDAMRIARDQIGKLNAQVNQDRQEALGADGYVWRGALDQRERPNHAELEGQRFDWDDPPLGGGTDEEEEGHPGEGIQCRCYAEPDFSAILDDL